MLENYITSDTPLASYLIQAGFRLLEIQYEIKPNNKRQASFLFELSPELHASVDLFNQGTATINLALYEHTKSSLIDRIMRRLP